MAEPGPRNLITDVPGLLVGQAEDAAVLRLGGHFELQFAFKRGDFNFTAENRGGQWKRHDGDQVVFLAFE